MLSVFGSSLEEVDQNREEILRELESKLPLNGAREVVRFRIEWIITELLQNHCDHGNNRNPSKRISVDCDITDDGIFLWDSSDEGGGFDPESLPDPTDEDHIESDHGRGVYSIREMVMEQSRDGVQGVFEYPNGDRPLGSCVRVEMPI